MHALIYPFCPDGVKEVSAQVHTLNYPFCTDGVKAVFRLITKANENTRRLGFCKITLQCFHWRLTPFQFCVNKPHCSKNQCATRSHFVKEAHPSHLTAGTHAPNKTNCLKNQLLSIPSNFEDQIKVGPASPASEPLRIKNDELMSMWCGRGGDFKLP